MGTTTARSALVAFAVTALLAPPGGLAAKERKGADLLVTKLDGTLVAGELIAVRRNSLIMLSPSRTDVSVAAAEIANVRIARPSKAGKGALWGGVGGIFIGGVLGGISGGIDEYTAGQAAVVLGFVCGAIGGLGGLGVGTLMSVDTDVPFAGEPEEIVRMRLEKLRPYSREYRLGGGRLELKIGPPPAPAQRPPARAPAPMGPAAPTPRRIPASRCDCPTPWPCGTPDIDRGGNLGMGRIRGISRRQAQDGSDGPAPRRRRQRVLHHPADRLPDLNVIEGE